MIILIRQNPKHNAREVVLTLFARIMPYHGAMVHDDSSQQLFSRRRFTVPSTSIPQTVPTPNPHIPNEVLGDSGARLGRGKNRAGAQQPFSGRSISSEKGRLYL